MQSSWNNHYWPKNSDRSHKEKVKYCHSNFKRSKRKHICQRWAKYYYLIYLGIVVLSSIGIMTKNSTKSFLREMIIWFLNLWFRVSCTQFNNLCSTAIETQLHMERNIFLEFGMLILLKEVIVFNFYLSWTKIYGLHQQASNL